MVITTYREADHPHRYKANWGWGFKGGKKKRIRVDDPGGRGKQIHREIPVCEAVWNRYQNGESLDSILGGNKR
jgi:hypothetical protein